MLLVIIHLFHSYHSLDVGNILDDFERDFQKLRNDIRDLKDKLKDRQE